MSPMEGVGYGDPFWLDAALIGVLICLCMAIAVIDWRHRIIPDACNLGVGLLGLAYAALGGGTPLLSAAVQGGVIFGLFWLVRRLYRALRNVQGLGLGDVKFLGAAGIWIGLQGIATLVLVACAAALAWIATEMLRGRAVSSRHSLPFGPFLALGLVVTLGMSFG